MTEDDRKFLNAAMQSRLLSMEQALQVKKAIDERPGQKAAGVAVELGLLNIQEVAQLRIEQRRGEGVSPPSSANMTPPAPAVLQKPDSTLRDISRTQGGGSATQAQTPVPKVLQTPEPSAPPPPSSKTASMSARPQSKRSATVTVEEKDRKAEKEFFSLLAKARELQGSVLHLRPLRPPFIRLFGRMESLGEVPLSPSEVERLIFSVLNSSQKERLIRQWQLEFGLTVEGLGRHRCNISRQQLGWEAAYRLIPEVVPTIASLGLPPVHRALCENRQGLVIVTGNAGSGKTTTIAAMLQHINETRRHHIITIEDPVEYVFDSNLAHITQREIGAHTESFPMALRGALRQDPDVMMIGDLRDLETTSIAISAAETGHLVLATLHTNSAMRTVARIMDVFPPSQRAQICIMVAESLRGIITQQLIPLRDHPGLALAQEILVVTPAAAQLIKEGKTHLLVSTMQSGKRLGMQTMDDALMELVQKKVISAEEAYTRSDNKVLFESLRKTN